MSIVPINCALSGPACGGPDRRTGMAGSAAGQPPPPVAATRGDALCIRPPETSRLPPDRSVPVDQKCRPRRELALRQVVRAGGRVISDEPLSILVTDPGGSTLRPLAAPPPPA